MAGKTKITSDDEVDKAAATQATSGKGTQQAPPTVRWDDSGMSTSYANVVNVISTREEVTLFFGTNQTWNIRDSREVTVGLTDRIVLNPYAAKRLWVLMGNVLKEYENRHGVLNLDSGDGRSR